MQRMTIPGTAKPIISAKKVKKKLDKRVQDLTQKVRVFIPELKLNVYVDPNMSIAAVRAKYLGQREFVRKTIAGYEA